MIPEPVRRAAEDGNICRAKPDLLPKLPVHGLLRGLVQLDTTATPEFDRWRWVDYWQPLRDVIYFKRAVYRQALQQLGPIVFPEGLPPLPDGIAAGEING